ncbi:hypothetical protein [Streptomyces hydrogenans]|uniref:Uncharacterized protein n=1 Tax=Streptomyces hydrogenans TaxID=1873719 RepID=A0ABQ3PJL6_9ACTN|nr:hypothetical protein [Streptomyces hydrogenans]GHG10167.1 hypothetical protein GCM10018784_23590 [Streptomyces hydrogenans]GHI25189.1 hypothetical protein Shyd_65600 [Streptomyces hydrogenans]
MTSLTPEGGYFAATSDRERLADLIRSFAVMCTRAEALAEVERFEKHIAHELAEKIRATYTGPGIDRYVRFAADLIDPEVP